MAHEPYKKMRYFF